MVPTSDRNVVNSIKFCEIAATVASSSKNSDIYTLGLLMASCSVTEEEGDIFVGALNFLRSVGIKPRARETIEAQEKKEEPKAPEPASDLPQPQYCLCTKNPHYQAPPEVPLELGAEVEARYGGSWLKATVIQIHKVSDDDSKWLYDVRYENSVPLLAVKLRRCLIRQSKEKIALQLFCTVCGLPPRTTVGFKSFKAGKGDRTFWAKPKDLYGLFLF